MPEPNFAGGLIPFIRTDSSFSRSIHHEDDELKSGVVLDVERNLARYERETVLKSLDMVRFGFDRNYGFIVC